MGKRIIGVLTVVLVLAAAACGQAPETTEIASDDLDQSTTSTEGPTDGDQPPEEVSQDESTEDVDEESPDNELPVLPISEDPCGAPPTFDAFGGSIAETEPFGFEFRGEIRPVHLWLSSAEALTSDDVVVLILLHGARGTVEQSKALFDFSVGPLLADQRPLAVIMPQADSSAAAFWFQDETFNVDYLTELADVLSNTLCVDRGSVLLGGNGQGAVASAQGYCAGAIEPDALFLWTGMTKILECEAEPVPVVSVDIYDFDAIIGLHWDGPWSPPSAIAMAAHGGFQATPDDVDFWANQFGCTDGPEETTIPLEGSERDITLLAVRSCPEPIVAVGIPGAEKWSLDTPFKMQEQVVAEIRPILLEELLDVLP